MENSRLNSTDSRNYQKWVRQNRIPISDDYDMEGYYRDIVKPGRDYTHIDELDKRRHFPDTYKKPNHPSFSDESMYAVGPNKALAGHWTGENFTGPGRVGLPEIRSQQNLMPQFNYPSLATPNATASVGPGNAPQGAMGLHAGPPGQINMDDLMQYLSMRQASMQPQPMSQPMGLPPKISLTNMIATLLGALPQHGMLGE